MTVIASTIKKDMKTKKSTYSFLINDIAFEAHYFFGKEPTLEILHNGSSLGIVSEKTTKFDFTVNAETFPIKITAWMNIGNTFSSILNPTNNGIGIEVDGKPVQNTLADPGYHIKNGKTAYYILLIILGIKSIFTYYTTFKGYSSHLVAAIACAIYFVPFLLALAALIFYFRWTTFAVYFGFILSILEFIDYLFGLPDAIRSNANQMVSILIWMVIRISALWLFSNALKWKNKQKKDSSIEL